MRHDNLPAGCEAVETASRDEIAALQLARLKKTLSWAYERVPRYKAKFDAAGVHPDDLTELQALARFPFTTKQDLRDTYPFGMFAVPMDDIVRVHASSGTTGKPTVVGYTAKDIDTWAGIMARSIRAAGGTRGDIIHITHGYGLFTGGLGVHYGAERLGCVVVPISGGQTERQVQLIQDFKPTMIVGTPSYVLNIVDEMERLGLDPRRTSLAKGMFGAEPWTEAMRAEMQGRLGIDAMDLYGLSEVMGPGVACECVEAKDGPVIWEDHFYPEVIDPETGEVLPDGSPGELVFTSLTKEALPVVRYRTRDLTRLLPPTARSFRRMGKITGRSDDMLIIRGVNVFPSQIEEQLLKVRELAPHYLLELSRRGHLDELDVLVEMKPEFAAAGEAAKERAAGELQHHIKSLIGISTRVRVREVGAIERSAGKAKRVVDRRPKAGLLGLRRRLDVIAAADLLARVGHRHRHAVDIHLHGALVGVRTGLLDVHGAGDGLPAGALHLVGGVLAAGLQVNDLAVVVVVGVAGGRLVGLSRRRADPVDLRRHAMAGWHTRHRPHLGRDFPQLPAAGRRGQRQGEQGGDGKQADCLHVESPWKVDYASGIRRQASGIGNSGYAPHCRR